MSRKRGHLRVSEEVIPVCRGDKDLNLSVFRGGMWFPFQISVFSDLVNTNKYI